MANVVKVAISYTIEPVFYLDDVAAGTITFHVMKPNYALPWNEDHVAELVAAIGQWLSGEPPERLDEDGHPVLPPWLPVDGFYPSNITFNLIEVFPVAPAPGDPYTFPIDVSGQSIIVDPTFEPPQTAYCVGLRTTLDTRRGRGRVFMPAFDMAHHSSTGLIVEGTRESLGRVFGLLQIYIQNVSPPGEPWSLCVYSRLDDDAHVIQHFSIGNRLCTQRRRRMRPMTYVNVGLDGEPF